MLRSRLIPCLLVHRKGLVKTTRFSEPKYVGDPINAVKIFNEKEVDELVVFDIDATVNKAEPDYRMIQNLAAECRMPLCYGGGVRTLEQAVRIIKLGAEKVALSSCAVANPKIIREIAQYVGGQSVVAVLDVRRSKKTGGFEVWTHNAKKNSGRDPVELAQEMEALGIGEITVNAIENDGVMKGYDLEIVRRIRTAVSVPMTVLGGAGSLEDVAKLVREFGIIGAAAGSLFVFKGSFRAVLINYPNREKKLELTTFVSANGGVA